MLFPNCRYRSTVKDFSKPTPCQCPSSLQACLAHTDLSWTSPITLTGEERLSRIRLSVRVPADSVRPCELCLCYQSHAPVPGICPPGCQGGGPPTHGGLCGLRHFGRLGILTLGLGLPISMASGGPPAANSGASVSVNGSRRLSGTSLRDPSGLLHDASNAACATVQIAPTAISRTNARTRASDLNLLALNSRITQTSSETTLCLV